MNRVIKQVKAFSKNLLYTLNQNPISSAFFEHEIINRSGLPVTNLVGLAQHLSIYSPVSSEIHKPNDWYGHASILKEYIGLPKTYTFKTIIEHGFYLNQQVASVELDSRLPSYLTYSNYRKGILEKYGKKAFAIGPLIKYAKTHLSEKELKKEKKRIGSCLTVFPFHSNPDLTFDYDIKDLHKKLQKIGKDFQTVRVNLYWTDILLGLHNKYQRLGFECVTAGHVMDPLFLPRLKSIISLSDFTVSNNISSPLSYCVAMDKPHFVIDQKPKLSGSKNESSLFNDYLQSEEYHTVLETFRKFTKRLTNEQIAVAKKYCGLNSFKSPKQFAAIIKKTERLYTN